MKLIMENWRRYMFEQEEPDTVNPAIVPMLPGDKDCSGCPRVWGPLYKGPLHGVKKKELSPYIKKQLENKKEGVDYYVDEFGYPKEIKTEKKADKIYQNELARAKREPGYDMGIDEWSPETRLFRYLLPRIFTDEQQDQGLVGDTIRQMHAKVSSFKKRPGRRQRPIPISRWSNYLERTLPPEYKFSHKKERLTKN